MEGKSPMDYTDVMVDLETTGLSKDHSAIIQIAAVRFNLETHDVDHNFFDKCLMIPPGRTWDENTRHWWIKDKSDILMSIYERMADPAAVITEFFDWSGGVVGPYRFWAKPISFDFPFLESYFTQFGLPMPYSHRVGRDLRSFIAGCNPTFNENTVPFEGTAHNALYDTLHQIRLLFAAMKGLNV